LFEYLRLLKTFFVISEDSIFILGSI